MTTKTSNQTSFDASYILNPANEELKVVVKTEKENKSLPLRPVFVKTHYSIDTDGGGYAGL